MGGGVAMEMQQLRHGTTALAIAVSVPPHYDL